jgi:hypothetical protein
MNTAHRISSVRTGRRIVSVAATMLFASTVLTFAPTAASAFDIGGLVGGAMALQLGGYHGSSYHHARVHVASRRDQESTTKDNSAAIEKDARQVAAPSQVGKSDSKVAVHQQPSGSAQSTLQASEGQPGTVAVASSAGSLDDAPTFSPVR